MNKPLKFGIIGILVSNLVGLATIGLTMLAARIPANDHSPDYSTLYVFSTFIIVPIMMGLYLEVIRSKGGMEQGNKALCSFLNLFVAYALCTVVLREGVICLFLASPLVILFHVLGVYLGSLVVRKSNRKLNSSIMPGLLTILMFDMLSPHAFHNSESDSMLIHARPEVVWQYIAAYPENREPANYWLWKLGLPAPVQSTVSSVKVGADRQCRFTGGVFAEERLTEVDPGNRLTFDVVKQLDHPEAVGHFKLERGQFVLQDNGDGTTTLTGTSWYELRVYPAWYYDFWVQDIMRKVHLRVMGHIKRLAEGVGEKQLQRKSL